MVIEPFLVHAVTLAAIRQTPISIFLLLVLLVITASMRIVQGRRQTPLRRKTMVNGQLRMLLRVVIRLVLVIDRRVRTVARRNGIFTSRVIASIGSVDAVSRLVAHAFPPHSGRLSAAKSTQDDLRLLAVPTDTAVVTVQIALGTIQESV